MALNNPSINSSTDSSIMFINMVLLALISYLLIISSFSRSMVLVIMLVDCYLSKYFNTHTFIENLILSVIIKN